MLVPIHAGKRQSCIVECKHLVDMRSEFTAQNQIPQIGICQPGNLDETLLFLASPAADHLTGITLHIDEGQALGAFQAARKQEKT